MADERKQHETRGDAPHRAASDERQQSQQNSQQRSPQPSPQNAPPRRGRDDARRESGQPGGGQGRRDEVGGSGVHPISAGTDPNRNAEIRTEAAWGQGERGAAGYEDSGGSELVMRDGQLLGGLTAGPSGEPTIDIHGGDKPAEDEGEKKSR